MNSLTQQYRQLDRDCALFYDRLNGKRNYEHTLFIPTEEAQLQGRRELEQLKQRGMALEAPDKVYAIIKQQILNFLDAQQLQFDSVYARPSKNINALIYAFSSIGRKDSREDGLRKTLLLHKYAMAEELWGAIAPKLEGTDPIYLQELVTTLDTFIRTTQFEAEHLQETFPSLHRDDSLKQQMESLCQKAEVWKKEAVEVIAKRGITPKAETAESDTIRFDETYYRALLKNELGIELDELLSWYEAEVEKTRAGVFAIVDKLDLAEEKPTTMAGVNAVLMKYAGPYENAEILFKKAQEYLDIAKAECRRIVPMPEEICKLTPIPEQIKYSYPWGGYGGGCPIRRPLMGEYYVNDFNYTAVTDGWIKMMAIHESYPGHHVQFVRRTVDQLPEVVKLGARSTPLIEGTAHRSEKVFEYLFPDDQFYPLFVAYRRHHTSVRIKAELWLRFFGKTIGEAVDLYVKELGFDRKTARGQVSAQESMQGYFNSYYYGLKKIEDLEKQYGFDKEEYTRYLFDAGNVSLELFEQFLGLSPEDKARYTHEFASILQFGE